MAYDGRSKVYEINTLFSRTANYLLECFGPIHHEVVFNLLDWLASWVFSIQHPTEILSCYPVGCDGGSAGI